MKKIEWVRERMVWLTLPYNNVVIATRVVDGKRKIIGGVSFIPPGHKYTQMDIVKAGILKTPFLWGFKVFIRLIAVSSVFEKQEAEVMKDSSYWRITNFAVHPDEQGKGMQVIRTSFRISLSPSRRNIQRFDPFSFFFFC